MLPIGNELLQSRTWVCYRYYSSNRRAVIVHMTRSLSHAGEYPLDANDLLLQRGSNMGVGKVYVGIGHGRKLEVNGVASPPVACYLFSGGIGTFISNPKLLHSQLLTVCAVA